MFSIAIFVFVVEVLCWHKRWLWIIVGRGDGGFKHCLRWRQSWQTVFPGTCTVLHALHSFALASLRKQEFTDCLALLGWVVHANVIHRHHLHVRSSSNFFTSKSNCINVVVFFFSYVLACRSPETQKAACEFAHEALPDDLDVQPYFDGIFIKGESWVTLTLQVKFRMSDDVWSPLPIHIAKVPTSLWNGIIRCLIATMSHNVALHGQG